MDPGPVVLCGRVAAAAWRLAGLRVRVFATGAADGTALAGAFAAACADAPLVLVEDDLARELPAPLLAAARRGLRPLVLVVPTIGPARADDLSRPPVPDVLAALSRVLGVAP
jgi:vacuolar-type H+-ATPase subunit F/Vma7